jgi:serine/threonine protein kinase
MATKRTREGDGGAQQAYGGAVRHAYGAAGGPHGAPSEEDKRKRRNNGHSSPSPSSESVDDNVGHIEIRVGDSLGEYRYLLEGGKGTFGLVLMCEDARARAGERSIVAIKVVRRIRKYTDSARIEASILEDLMRADPRGRSNCVRYLRSFDWRGHFCMVFEPLGKSLYDLVRANRYRPLPLYCVQSFADQLCAAVAFLHRMRLIHTDLKLENVLLVGREDFARVEKPSHRRVQETLVAPGGALDIKLIDFGGATYDFEAKEGLVNTRQYRGPEVILGMQWGLPSDVWSVGCILMELYTGKLLFETVRGP